MLYDSAHNMQWADVKWLFVDYETAYQFLRTFEIAQLKWEEM